MKKITRRTFLKGSGALIPFLISGFGYMYIRYIEPFYVHTVFKTLSSTTIPKELSGKRIVQFSDIHLSSTYTLKKLRRLVKQINSLSPDLVFFTGDLIDAPQQYKEAGEIPSILKQIKAPLGKFAVYGNHDHGGFGTNLYEEIMKKSHFQLLKNSSVRIEGSDEKALVIYGLDDVMLGKPNLAQTLQNASQEFFSIVLVHEPDIAPEVARYPINLQLSGHTHGGQIQLPFIGPIVTPPYGTNYVEGLYTVQHSAMKLYVNRGLGTTRLPFRLLAPPELTIFTLNHIRP